MSNYLVTDAEIDINDSNIAIKALNHIMGDVSAVVGIVPKTENNMSVTVKKKDIQYTYLIEWGILLSAIKETIKNEDFHQEILKQNKDLELVNYTYRYYSPDSCVFKLMYQAK